MKRLSNVGRNIAIRIDTMDRVHKITTGKSTPWTNMFKSEDEIINALKEIPTDVPIMYPHPYKGYEYIHSFARTIQNSKNLSSSQMKQAKRLAVQIKIAYAIRYEWMEGN